VAATTGDTTIPAAIKRTAAVGAASRRTPVGVALKKMVAATRRTPEDTRRRGEAIITKRRDEATRKIREATRRRGEVVRKKEGGVIRRRDGAMSGAVRLPTTGRTPTPARITRLSRRSSSPGKCEGWLF
jgi:hypothetical protein